MGPVGLPPGLCTLCNLLQAKSDAPQRCTPTFLATRHILSLTGQKADGCAGNQDFPPWVRQPGRQEPGLLCAPRKVWTLSEHLSLDRYL